MISIDELQKHHEEFVKRVEASGEELMGQTLPELKEEEFLLYEQTGNRLIYEEKYFERRRFLNVYGLLTMWYGRSRDVEKLKYVIKEICAEKTWALPAHVNRKEADWERTVDLFAAETGQALANIISVSKDKLGDSFFEEVKKIIVYRVLDSYMEVPKGEWRWEKMYNNWVAVCAGCLGSMALFLLKDDEKKQKAVIDRVCSTLPDYLSGMYDDGACPEGLSYFTYGMVFYTGFAQQLKEYSHGAIDLMDNDKLRKIARFQQLCYMPKGATISFSDGDRKDRYRLGLTCRLAELFTEVEIPDIALSMDFDTDGCYRFMGNLQDDIWVKEYIKNHEKSSEPAKEKEFYVLPKAEWAVWKKNRMGIAFKGGNNNESHNHNDIGSFIVSYDGEMLLTDLGGGEYTKDYFNPKERYRIFCNRSLGHSVPVINGREQCAGKEYKTDYFKCGAGRAEISYAKAYGQQGIALKRSIESGEGLEEFTIYDEIKAQNHVEMKENLITQTEPVISGDSILVKGKNKSLALQIEGYTGKITAEKNIFQNHAGRAEDVWSIQFDAGISDGKGNCIIKGKIID